MTLKAGKGTRGGGAGWGHRVGVGPTCSPPSLLYETLEVIVHSFVTIFQAITAIIIGDTDLFGLICR